eukprot:2060266-Rhodomonas_salina.1
MFAKPQQNAVKLLSEFRGTEQRNDDGPARRTCEKEEEVWEDAEDGQGWQIMDVDARCAIPVIPTLVTRDAEPST